MEESLDESADATTVRAQPKTYVVMYGTRRLTERDWSPYLRTLQKSKVDIFCDIQTPPIVQDLLPVVKDPIIARIGDVMRIRGYFDVALSCFNSRKRASA